MLSLALMLFVVGQMSAGTKVLVSDTLFDRAAHEQDFAFGADVSWLSQQESWGTVYRDRQGRARDLMDILKEEGINTLCFRVWVNPSGGWSGKNDVVNLCRRARKKGFRLLVGFHYSDTWADSGHQDKPGSWKDHTAAQLIQDVYDHTYDVLSALKQQGITPDWVKIGNETKYGMLWDDGKTKSTAGYDLFAKMIDSGCDAVHAVDSTIRTIVHLPEGHNWALYKSMFDQLKARHCKFDIIGMSAYPRWSHLDGPEMIVQTLANIKNLQGRYGKPVMVVETGHYNDRPLESNQFLADFMKQLLDNKVLGCCYWEPEAMSGYNLGAWDPTTHQASIAMDAFRGVRYREADYLMKASVESPGNLDVLGDVASVKVKVNATHVANRMKAVEVFLDNMKRASMAQSPYDTVVGQVARGRHTMCAMAIDSDNHTQMSDTLTFVTGPYAQLSAAPAAGDGGKGTKMTWGVCFPDSGKYQFVFQYAKTDTFRLATLTVGGDKGYISFPRTPRGNMASANVIVGAGEKTVTLAAATAAGLPQMVHLYMVPMVGDALPAESTDGIGAAETVGATGAPRCYTMGGMRLAAPRKGLNIVVQKHNGMVETKKMLR